MKKKQSEGNGAPRRYRRRSGVDVEALLIHVRTAVAPYVGVAEELQVMVRRGETTLVDMRLKLNVEQPQQRRRRRGVDLESSLPIPALCQEHSSSTEV